MFNNIVGYDVRSDAIMRRCIQVLSEGTGRKILLLSDRRGHLDYLNACFTKMKENIRNKKRRWNIIDVIDENYLDATFKITSTMLLELHECVFHENEREYTE